MVKTFENQIYFDRFLRLNPTRDTHPKKFLSGIPELVKEKVIPQMSKLKMIGGHFAFGIHAHVGDAPNYVTVLRNPIERVISEYFYMKQKGFYYQELILKEDLSLANYLNHPETEYLNNLQTRLISGVTYENGDKVTDEIYEIALKNLREMRTVGISEKFSESLALFAILLKWERIPIHTIANRNDQRPKIDSLDSDTIKQIEQREKYDLALYNEAKKLFSDQLRTNREQIDKLLSKIENPNLFRRGSKQVFYVAHKLKSKLF